MPSPRTLPTQRLADLAAEAYAHYRALTGLQKALDEVLRNWGTLADEARFTILEDARVTAGVTTAPALHTTLAYLKLNGRRLLSNRKNVARNKGYSNVSPYVPEVPEDTEATPPPPAEFTVEEVEALLSKLGE